jgi:hypothetical protein
MILCSASFMFSLCCILDSVLLQLDFVLRGTWNCNVVV